MFFPALLALRVRRAHAAVLHDAGALTKNGFGAGWKRD
jgi:hypothetical protein